MPAMPIKEKLLLAKKAGFAGFEIAFTEDGDITPKTPEKDLLDIKSFARDNGIELSGLATGLYWKYNFMSDNAEERKKAVETAVRQIETAAILETKNILLLPGSVYESTDYETAWFRSQEEIQKIIPCAGSCNIKIGIENVWNKFLMSPMEAKLFVDSFNSDNIGFYLDIGNVILFGYPEHWIKILGKRIINVHFKDYNRASDCYVDLLAGDVNYIGVINALESIGYDGWVNAEMAVYKRYSDQIVYNTSSAMDRILGKK